MDLLRKTTNLEVVRQNVCTLYLLSSTSHNIGDKGDKWLRSRVSIKVQTASWNILVTATAGSGAAGDIAIDDFSMEDGLCQGKGKTSGAGK